VSGRFSVGERLGSFRHAFAGVITLLREQHNARIHLAATLVVLGLALSLDVSRGDWLALLLAIGLVWTAEAFNTALEYLADAAVPERHPLVKKAKDSAAAGVLLAATIAVAVGLWVFLPKILYGPP
jgi:diacylglycerol kinase